MRTRSEEYDFWFTNNLLLNNVNIRKRLNRPTLRDPDGQKSMLARFSVESGHDDHQIKFGL